MIEKLFEEFPAILKPQRLLLSKGENLFKQGDSVLHIYFIKQGKIKLIRNTSSGSPILLHIGQQGESIAEASIFSNQYHCSAIADSKSKIGFVRKQRLLQFLQENPKVMMELLAIFSRQIRDLRTINEIKNIHSAKERMLTYIKMKVDENNELILNLSLKDMAHKIGLAHETFYRTLKVLEDSGELHRTSYCIKLIQK
ncbi:MAG: Crp/Fnr family transcriptional regulator [Cocleimonas sp.]|nr:Crp/Fnr family transcriptional regulator [Cocleimonas sp.]